MPSAFISYAREDESAAKVLEAGLQENGISVWRDQQSLQAGQDWPEALGEAIAAQDYFVLLWSAHAQGSNFVKREWNSAFAQNKPILPVRLDGTPLPHSLRAVHSLEGEDLQEIIPKIVSAIHQQPIPAQSFPAQTLTKKTRHLEPWHKWVGTLAVLCTILAVGYTFYKDTAQTQGADNSRTQTPKSALLHVVGKIKNQKNAPISDVKVVLTSLTDPTLESTTHTNDNGRYDFEVKGIEGQEVQVEATKPCFSPASKTTFLGNTGFTFKMKGDLTCEN